MSGETHAVQQQL